MQFWRGKLLADFDDQADIFQNPCDRFTAFLGAGINDGASFGMDFPGDGFGPGGRAVDGFHELGLDFFECMTLAVEKDCFVYEPLAAVVGW